MGDLLHADDDLSRFAKRTLTQFLDARRPFFEVLRGTGNFIGVHEKSIPGRSRWSSASLTMHYATLLLFHSEATSGNPRCGRYSTSATREPTTQTHGARRQAIRQRTPHWRRDP